MNASYLSPTFLLLRGFFVTICLIISGLSFSLALFPNFRKKYITFTNELKGVKTKITSTTANYWEIGGLISGIVALIMAFVALVAI